MVKEKFLRIIRKNGDSLAINIPIEIVKLLKIKDGDLVRAEIEKINGNENK